MQTEINKARAKHSGGFWSFETFITPRILNIVFGLSIVGLIFVSMAMASESMGMALVVGIGGFISTRIGLETIAVKFMINDKLDTLIKLKSAELEEQLKIKENK